MGIQREIWARDIAENLFPDNSFMARAVDDSEFVEGAVVHLPQSGAKPNVQRNRSVLPAVIAQRTDTDATYNIDEFTSDPTLIKDADEIETSYNKRQNVLEDHNNQLNTQIAEWMGYNWAPTQAANYVRTNGADRVAFVAGATGNRKKILLDDWLAAKRLLDNMDVPDDGRRFALVPAEMYNDLLEIDKILSSEFNLTGRLPNGVVNEIFGIKIFKRSSSISYSNAATPALRAPDAAALTTANAGVLMWHERFVRRALGSVKVYANEDEAAYYGSVFSAMALAGGRKRYNDQSGVVAIIEAAGS